MPTSGEQRRPGYTRIVRVLRKWEHGRTPDDGEPDSVTERVFWLTPRGRDVTSAKQIARLEKRYARTMKESSDALSNVDR